jgi:serine O-acetyltransferase
MGFRELKEIWSSDLYRYYGKVNKKIFIRTLNSNPGFKCSFWMRLCSYLKSNNHNFLFYICIRILRRYQYKYGIEIPYNTKVGKGLLIGHFSGIFVNPQAILGKNVNIFQNVTIGEVNRGKNKGAPVIGDNVIIYPGAKIIGGVKIGNNVSVGANCVVTKNIPDNSVVVGIPGKVISSEGTEGLILNTDYKY